MILRRPNIASQDEEYVVMDRRGWWRSECSDEDASFSEAEYVFDQVHFTFDGCQFAVEDLCLSLVVLTLLMRLETDDVNTYDKSAL
jgi:hypothetical protein